MGRENPFLVMTVLMFECETSAEPIETIVITPEKTHKYHKEYDYGAVIVNRMVLKGQSISNWTEAWEIVNGLRENYPPTLKECFNSLIEIEKAKCPTIKVDVISKDSSSILYKVKTTNCPKLSDEESIRKILYGNINVFCIIYTNKIKDIPKKTRNEWIRILSSAKIWYR